VRESVGHIVATASVTGKLGAISIGDNIMRVVIEAVEELLTTSPKGLPSAIYTLLYSNIMPCHIGPPQQADKEGAGMKKDRRREERSEIMKEEFTVYDRVCYD
jgi:hypothetical protein